MPKEDVMPSPRIFWPDTAPLLTPFAAAINALA
jgi:hypothetical protein